MTASFLWLAASTGAVSLLTPCVFPMIPITIAYFNSRGDVSRRHVAIHAFLFGAGIVTTFTALGLGLAIVRKVVDAHDGRITAVSAPGRGAAFKVTLPVVPSVRSMGR